MLRGAGEQGGARQGALGGVGLQVEGDAGVGGAVPGEMAVEEVVERPLGCGQQGAQGAGLGGDIQLAGVPADPGQQQHGVGVLDGGGGRGEGGGAAGDGDEGDAGEGAVAAAGVAGAQMESGALGGEQAALSDGEFLRDAGQPVVEVDAEAWAGPGDVLHHDVVGAGDEDAAGPAGAFGAGDAGGEVDGAAVVVAGAAGAAQADTEGGVEGLHPLQGGGRR
ncbi:hypothetical protein GCM10020256_19240 [Streptomyces thermocoprophilus]